MSTLEEKLEQGIAAAQAGHKQKARTLLAEVVETDESQLEAWLWLYQVVDSLEEKTICLENVLTLEPAHDFAQAALAELQAEQARLFKPIYAPGQEAPPPTVVTPPPASPITAKDPYPEDEFDNEWLCPYCLALTQSADRACPTCRRPLVFRTRVREERSAWLWRGIFFQWGMVLALFAFGTMAFTIVAWLNGLPNAIHFLPLYFGQSTNQPDAFNQAMLALFPRWLFWSLVIAIFYSLGLALLLYLRVPYGNLITLISAGVMFSLGLFCLLFFYHSRLGLGAGVLFLITGGVQLLVTLNLWDDFTFKENRLRLRLDRDAKSHTTLYLSARSYLKQGMWALAALHLRRAISREPRWPTYHLSLALAYLNLQRPTLAAQSLSEAERLDPHAPKLAAIKQALKRGPTPN